MIGEGPMRGRVGLIDDAAARGNRCLKSRLDLIPGDGHIYVHRMS